MDSVPQVTHDSIFVNRIQYDSVYLADSFIERYRPSTFVYDTIFKTYLRVDTVYRERTTRGSRMKMVHDTLYVHKVDSVTVVQKVPVVQKERYIPPWCKYLAIIGAITLLIIIIYPIIKFKLK